MADNAALNRSPRLMFLLNNDYGELGLAMFFLQGRDLVNLSTVLLPPRLFATNQHTLPCTTYKYNSLEDVIEVVDAEQPDIFFLFSGYILPNHDLLSLAGMADLVKLLRERDIIVSTSDPFFGIFSRMGPANINGPESLQLFETDLIPDLTWEYRINATCGNLRILEQFAIASHILKDTIHLYYCCPDPQDEPEAGAPYVLEGPERTATFFNPCLIEDDKPTSPSAAGTQELSGAGAQEKPHWLYILGEVDYDLQIHLYPEAEFFNILERHLRETLAQGRRFILLAPSECVAKLRSRVPISARKDLLNFCAYETFTSLMLDAEYVFYWNLASYSTFLRVVNQRPMFMFDGGHLVRHVKPMVERMGYFYYQSWTPPFLDPHAPLSVDVLSGLAEEYRRDTDRIVSNLKALPSPDQVIEDILAQAR